MPAAKSLRYDNERGQSVPVITLHLKGDKNNMLNICAIQGRLAADPELRQTTTGKQVATFRVACDRGVKDANGQRTADWITVVAWEHRADFVCKYFGKGDMIAVTGRLQSRTYQDKNGNNRTALEVVANSLDFCGGKSAAPAPAGGTSPALSTGPELDFALIEDEGDLPF